MPARITMVNWKRWKKNSAYTSTPRQGKCPILILKILKSWFFYNDIMNDIWEQVAPQQRLNELLKLLKEQKDKDSEHDRRDDAREDKSDKMDIQLAELIEILTKRLLELERRVAELEKKNNL